MNSDLFSYANARPKSADPEALIGDLNAPQREAVQCNDGPVLVLAGAGSGKTRALTRKIAWLVSQEGFAPWEILAVTFTNKAAAEMRERCFELMGEDARELWMGTFHSIGVKILRRHGEALGMPRSFTIYDRDDMKAMITRVIKGLGLDTEVYNARGAMAYIDKAKQLAQWPDHADIPNGTMVERTHRRIYECYEAAMRAAGAVDFGDLIALPLRLFREHPLIASEYKQRWRYMLVDEFQDTNHTQAKLLEIVLNDDRRICVVGDDDQSIYRWRGADVSNILDFDKRFPDAAVIRLEQNYRSSGNILAVSGALIARNTTRHGKELWTDREEGSKVRVFEANTEREEADYVVRRLVELGIKYARDETAIFYRTNAQSRSFEDTLRRNNIPYRVFGGLRFYDRAEIKDLLAYLKVLANPLDVVSLERIINVPSRKIGKRSVEKIREAASANGATIWDALTQMVGEGGALAKKLTPFKTLVEGLRELSETADVLGLLEAIIDRTGYANKLKVEGTAEADARLENIRELVNAVGEFVEDSDDKGLAAFLDQVSLQSALDGEDEGRPAVALMTAHMAKGLEFDVVFVTGMEEGLMPHFNSQDTQDDIEEERRLCYVAMTRARHELHLSWALSRRRFGTVTTSVPSRFVDGLPRKAMLWEERTHSSGSYGSGYGSGSRSGSGGGNATYGRSNQGLAWSNNKTAAPVKRQMAGDQANNMDETAQVMPDYSSFSQVESEPSGDGIVYDEGMTDGPIEERAVVFHTTYGEGRVLRVTGNEPKRKARVKFRDGQERTIVARFLTRLR